MITQKLSILPTATCSLKDSNAPLINTIEDRRYTIIRQANKAGERAVIRERSYNVVYMIRNVLRLVQLATYMHGNDRRNSRRVGHAVLGLLR